MKYLLTVALAFIMITAQAQSVEVGTKYAQIGASPDHVYAQASYSHNVVWMVNTKVSLGAGVYQGTEEQYVLNNGSRIYNGVDEPSMALAVMPSAMVGIDIPIKDFKLGIYTGFRSYNTNTFYDPVSLTLRF